jgi:hypothetical protein
VRARAEVVFAAIALASFGSLALLVGRPAEAGYRDCPRRSLDHADDARARSQMRRAAEGRARMLFRQGLDRIPSLTVADNCDASYRWDKDPDGTHMMAELRRTLAPAEIHGADIEPPIGNQIDVQLYQYGLTFEREAEAPGKFVFRCWYELVVVT